MSLSVYANNMGFWHKGSDGKGIAPLDVCLSPPPPPAGPIPIPYVNIVMSSDLAKGSKTVKIDGEPTALEDASHCTTSSGDEPGTQGGGVVSHKTKGKANFTLWSFDVKVEGKGVGRHGDPLLQNTGSPPNCCALGAMNRFNAAIAKMPQNSGKKCPPYDSKKHRPRRTAAQRDAVNGMPCWECKDDDGTKPFLNGGKKRKPSFRFDENGKKVKAEYRTHDHQPTLERAWRKGGCHLKPSPKAFKELMGRPEFVKPHCEKHYRSQGPKVKAASKANK